MPYHLKHVDNEEDEELEGPEKEEEEEEEEDEDEEERKRPGQAMLTKRRECKCPRNSEVDTCEVGS